MNDDVANEIFGALSAHMFILENLYAALLSTDADPKAACRATASEMLRQFDLPHRAPAVMDADQMIAIKGHATIRLQRFWDEVEARLRSANL